MSLKIDFCQINSSPGDLQGNLSKIISYYNCSNADLVVFPELSVTGYNCGDLFLDESFLLEVEKSIKKLQLIAEKKALLVGFPRLEKGQVFNSAILLSGGENLLIYDKYFLPNYDTFNEKRYFTPGSQHSLTFNLKQTSIRLLICEDLWEQPGPELQPVDVTLAINASPFTGNKAQLRVKHFKQWVKGGVGIYLNAIGGQDHFVFDGGSFIINDKGNFLLPPQSWIEESFDYSSNTSKVISRIAEQLEAGALYQAIMLAMYDYLRLNNFEKVIIGLSGGIDSALVTTLAVDVLGPEKVITATMPSQYSSPSSTVDALSLAENLNCKLLQIPIQDLYKNFQATLEGILQKAGLKSITCENIQPRIRSTLLMALANEEKALLLSTSNKSESAVGYTTIYGDMAGGFAPIIDLYKTEVYKLVAWRNMNRPQNPNNLYYISDKLDIIPSAIVKKEPSAELKYNQKDCDTLPPYEILDSILCHLIEKETLPSTIEDSIVTKITQLLQNSEFKRQQSPCGPKISNKMLSIDRQYPISLIKNNAQS